MINDGRAWIRDQFGEQAVDRTGEFVDRVIAENEHQNLVAPSTVPAIWERHALDSAQLMTFDRPDSHWVDIGSGGGFPGMVIALLRSGPVTLVEPRKRRAQFLSDVASAMGLGHVAVVGSRIERWHGVADIVSARAVATIPALIQAASHCTNTATRWILPRGRSAQDDLGNFRESWDGVFHVEQSLSDPASSIVVLDRVTCR